MKKDYDEYDRPFAASSTPSAEEIQRRIMASQERRLRAPVYNCPACNTQIIKLKGLVKHMTTCCKDTMDVDGWHQVRRAGNLM